MAADRLSISLQENLLLVSCFDERYGLVVRNLVPADLFEGEYRKVIARVYDYIDHQKQVPGTHVPDLFDDILEGKDDKKAKLYAKILQDLIENQGGLNGEYVVGRAEKFIRQQSLKDGILRAAEILQTTGDLDGAEDTLRQSMDKRVSLFDPGTRLLDFDRSLAFLSQEEEAFWLGIPELDDRNLGPARKELHLYIGLPKSGKCIAAGNRVLLADGSIQLIEDVVASASENVFSLDVDSGRFRPGSVAKYYDNGPKECLTVVTKSGRSITVSKDDSLLRPSGWTNILELSVGNSIAVPRHIEISGTDSPPKEYARLMGYLIAEGCLLGTAYSFTNEDEAIKLDFEHCCNFFGSAVTWVNSISGYITNSKSDKGLHNKNPVKSLIDNVGLAGKRSYEKTIPNSIFRSNKETISEFIRALFSGDGSVYGSTTIEYCTTSKDLAEGIHHLLLRFGIISKLKQRTSGTYRNSYHIIISDYLNVESFVRQIGFIGEKQTKALALLSDRSSFNTRSYLDCLPKDVVSYLSGIYRTVGGLLKYSSNQNRSIGRNRFHELEKNGIPSLFISPDVLWDTIVSISDAGILHTYDLAVAHDHNFIANDVIVHNTWWFVNMGKRSLIDRRKVVHITLEMSEPKMSQRYYQALFGMSKREEEYLINEFQRDELGRLMGFKDFSLKPKLFLSDPEIANKLRTKTTEAGLRLNNLIIKQFPTGQLNVRELVSYLDMLELQQGYIPDLVILDYADLMYVNPANFRHELGTIYKDLRGVAVERNIAVATASQSNRAGAGSKKIDNSNVAEDWSKIFTADSVITYNQTEAEHALGLARLFVAAGRNDADKFSILLSQNYATGQYVLDSIPMLSNYWDILNQETGND